MTTALLPAEPETVDASVFAGDVLDAAGSVTVPSRRSRDVDLDPRDLVDNPRNARVKPYDVEDLKASITQVGILCPLIVVPVTVTETVTDTVLVDGVEIEVQTQVEVERFQIVIGHRRKQAAIDLGLDLVPCWVAADEDAAAQILAQLAENGHRVGLALTEEAELYHQLTLLDWTPERIAGFRAVPAAKVQQTLLLRELPQAARTVADAGTVDLVALAELKEFADEPAVVERLVASASSTWGMQHAVIGERAKRKFAAAKERARAELILAGVKVTGKPKQFGWGSVEVEARQLCDADGERLDLQQVRAWPGFAAFIEKIGDEPRVVVYCTDPAKYGYTRNTGARNPAVPAVLSEAEQAEREAREQARQEYIDGLTVAATVRQQFYRATYSTAKAAKQLNADVLRDLVTGRCPDRFATEDIALYTALGGVDGAVIATAGEDRLRRCMVAQWICAHEHNLTLAIQPYSGFDDTAALAWLNRLVADGYQLSPAETTLHQQLNPADPDSEAETEAEADVDVDEDLDGEVDDEDRRQLLAELDEERGADATGSGPGDLDKELAALTEAESLTTG
ncbi:ParB/RepB/Spo0J family partition protein [Dactylosporangium sp. NPDC000521]|uniref:ParB/RepB/Spo0J family partition protein n=1 Tax=Dactylosporangium sp. NPDC000521 TaxID=3363975 RepID=UPI0036C7521D